MPKSIKPSSIMQHTIKQIACALKLDKPFPITPFFHAPESPLTLTYLGPDRLEVMQGERTVEFWICKSEWYPYAATINGQRHSYAEFTPAGVQSLKINQQSALVATCHKWAKALTAAGWLEQKKDEEKKSVDALQPNDYDYIFIPGEKDAPRDTIDYPTPLQCLKELDKELFYDSGKLGILISELMGNDPECILELFKATLDHAEMNYELDCVEEWIADLEDPDLDDEEDEEEDLDYFDEPDDDDLDNDDIEELAAIGEPIGRFYIPSEMRIGVEASGNSEFGLKLVERPLVPAWNPLHDNDYWWQYDPLLGKKDVPFDTQFIA